MTVRISIAMATYNGANFLQEQLDSFLSQTRQPDELVVCDDGSTDGTVSILENFSRNAPFDVLIYRNDTNLGYTKNFEKALSICSGDIIFLSDQDDVWFKEKVERVTREFLTNPIPCAIINDAEIVRKDLTPTGLTVAGQLVTAGMDIEDLLLGCCIAIRRTMLPLIFPIPSHIHGHDGWINALVRVLHCRFFVPDVLQFYRRHESNTSAFPTTRIKSTKSWHLLVEKIRWKNLKHSPLLASDVRIDQIVFLLNRLKANREYIDGVLLKSISLDKAIEKLQIELNSNMFRRSLQQLTFPKRLVECSKFFFAGGYQRFEGWRSFVRDLSL